MGVLCFNKVLVYKKLSVVGNENFYNVIVKVRNLYLLFFEEIVFVIVEVIDSNDYILVFMLFLYNFFVVCDINVGVIVGCVEVVDDWDVGINVFVCYEVVSGNGILWLNIDLDCGNVIVVSFFNILGVFYLWVRVWDLG